MIFLISQVPLIKKAYTLMLFGVEFPLFPCFVWCDCYPDLHVYIKLSWDFSPAAPVLWPEVELRNSESFLAVKF